MALTGQQLIDGTEQLIADVKANKVGRAQIDEAVAAYIQSPRGLQIATAAFVSGPVEGITNALKTGIVLGLYAATQGATFDDARTSVPAVAGASEDSFAVAPATSIN